MNTHMRGIDTVYRGYRFRSRLEARWAYYFDLLGVPFEYEAQGYELEAGRYLPDFWLPREQFYVEVKPHVDGEDRDAALKKSAALAGASGRPVAVTNGDPLDGVQWVSVDGGYPKFLELNACISCGRLFPSSTGRYYGGSFGCPDGCLGDAAYYDPDCVWFLKRAAMLARGARFEFGQTPKAEQLPQVPGWYGNYPVYLAGKVPEEQCEKAPEVERDGYTELGDCDCDERYCDTRNWRQELFGARIPTDHSTSHGFAYAGPNMNVGHGQIGEVVGSCLTGVDNSDAVFAWIHRPDVQGTLIEIGYARGQHKAIFVALDSARGRDFVQDHWFVADVSTRWAALPDVRLAWRLFASWWAVKIGAGA